MKQTNNAIRFLTAQYRAIFRKAYLKGLATAIVLTAGLASTGTANATDNPYTTLDALQKAKPTNGFIEITAESSKTGGLGVTKVHNESTIGGTGTSETIGIGAGLRITGNATDAKINLSQETKLTDVTVTFDGDLDIQSSGKLTIGEEGDAGQGQHLDVVSARGEGRTARALTVGFKNIKVAEGATLEIIAPAVNTNTGKKTTKVLTDLTRGTTTINGAVTIKSNAGVQNAFLQSPEITVSGAKAKVVLDASVENKDTSNRSRAGLGLRVYENGYAGKENNSGSAISVNNGATIFMTSHLGSTNRNESVIWGRSLNVDGAKLTVLGGESAGVSVINSYDAQIKNKSELFVGSGAALAFTPGKNNYLNAANKKNKKVYDDASGSDTSKNFAGTVTLSDSKVLLEGSLLLNRGGTLKIDDSVTLKSVKSGDTATQGMLAIGIDDNYDFSYKGTVNPTLEISSKKLGEFFKGSAGTQHKVIANTDNTTSSAYTETDGRLFLKDGARLKLTDTATVEMSDFKFGKLNTSAAAAAAVTPAEGSDGQIFAYRQDQDGILGPNDSAAEHKMDGDIQIVANNMSISKSLLPKDAAASTAGKSANSSENIKFVAKDLGLGGGEGFKSAESALGVGSLEAKNVTFKADHGTNKTFTLKDALTLRSITNGGEDLPVGENGIITGDVIVAGGAEKPMTVDGGVYSASGKVTLNSGSLIVENTKKADKSTLTLNGLTVDLSSGNSSIKVDGGLSGEYDPDNAEHTLTLLDLRNGGFTVGKDDTNKANVTVTSGAGMFVNAEDLNRIFADSPKNIALTVNKGGLLKADGDLKIDFIGKTTELKDKAGIFSGVKNGGILETDSLTVEMNISDATDADLKGANFGFGFQGATLRQGELIINNTNTAEGKAHDMYLTNGTFEVSKALISGDDKIILSQAAGSGYDKGVTLRFETQSESDEGVINMTAAGGGSIVLQDKDESSSGKKTILEFAQGKWTAANVTFDVKGGTMSVGSKDTASVLTAEGFAVSDGNVNVTEFGSATINSLKQTGGKITVDGTLTVNGKAPSSDDAADFGVALKDVTVGGNLNFGDNATKGIVTVKGGAVTVNEGAKDKLTLTDNGEVSLSLSGTLTLDSVKKLKQDLFTANSFNGAETDGSLKGFINLGQASIGVKPDASGNIAWDDFKPVSDITGVTTDALKGATVTGVTSSAQFKGSVGSVQTASGNGTVNVTGNTALNKANGNGLFAAESDGKTAASVNVSGDGTDLKLVGSGAVKDVNLADGTSLTTAGKGDISVNAIKGKGDLVLDSNVTVADRVEGKSLTSAAGTTLTAKSITVSGDDSFVEGNMKVAGDARFDGEMVELFGTNEIGGDLTLGSTGTGKWSGIYGDTTLTNASGKVTFNNSGEIGDGALLTAHTVTVSGSANALYVGEEESIEPGTDKTNPSTTGYLQVNGNLNLNGKYLVVDPAYGLATSVAAVKSFTEQTNTGIKAAGGKLDGDVVLGRNGALMVGANATVDAAKSLIERYQVNGSLVSPEDDGVGAVMIVDSRTVVGKDKRIILDPSRSGNEIIGGGDFFKGKGVIGTAYNGTGDYANKPADLYLGKGSVLHFTDNVLAETGSTVKGAIHFDKTDAAIKGEAGAKIVLGDAYLNTSGIVLFTDKGNTVTGKNTAGDGTGVLVMDNDIRVESLNGLMFFTLKAGEETSAQSLSLDYNRIDRAFLEASVPVRDSLLQYASGTMNYEEFFEPVGENGTPVEQEKVLGNLAAGHKVNEKGQIVDANGAVVKNPDLFIVVSEKDDEGNVVNTVYHKPSNAFLANVTQKTQGRDADLLARLAAFGGTAQAALTASSLTSDAVAGRMGMGASAGNITFADNGQGAGMWISPVYRNHDSDGFKAQGLNYGVDMDLTGVAIGGDFTTASGIRFGAAFNLGTGDAKGQGAGDGVKNDFDYVGFSIYGGYSAGALSVVGDVSYTVVDNDLEAHTSVEKVKASADSKALSVGVTGTYAFDLSGVTVAPHAGVRYTSIDVDDFAYDGEATGRIGEYKGDSLNVFSIPVGVTVSKDIVAGSWTVKPSFDLTLTANTGDDSVDGKVQWSGVSNMRTAVQSEVVDSFTYGATIGVSAKSGNISFGAGLNYTGSSNADEFGVNANARFVF